MRNDLKAAIEALTGKSRPTEWGCGIGVVVSASGLYPAHRVPGDKSSGLNVQGVKQETALILQKNKAYYGILERRKRYDIQL